MIAVPFIYFTILAMWLMIRYGGINISAFLALIYAFSAFNSILVDIFNVYNIHGVCAKQSIDIMAIFFYCGLLTLSILPFRYIHTSANTKINVQKRWVIDLMSWILIFTFIITTYHQLKNSDSNMFMNLKEVRDQVYIEEDKPKVTTLQWLLELPAALFAQFSPIAILIYFINIIHHKKSLYFNLLLLMSSLTPIVQAINIAGRTQPTYWVLSYTMLYIFLRPMMDRKMRRKSLLPLWIVGTVILSFIILVSIARFRVSNVLEDGALYKSLLAYTGESFINFNDYFVNYSARDIHLDRIFPLTNYFIVHPGWQLNDYRDMIWCASGRNIGVFFTFLGDLMIDLGRKGMVVYVTLFVILSNTLCKHAFHNNYISLSRILIILMLVLVPLQGVFYYSFYKVDVGFYIVGTIFLSFILKNKFIFK